MTCGKQHNRVTATELQRETVSALLSPYLLMLHHCLPPPTSCLLPFHPPNHHLLLCQRATVYVYLLDVLGLFTCLFTSCSRRERPTDWQAQINNISGRARIELITIPIPPVGIIWKSAAETRPVGEYHPEAWPSIRTLHTTELLMY